MTERTETLHPHIIDLGITDHGVISSVCGEKIKWDGERKHLGMQENTP